MDKELDDLINEEGEDAAEELVDNEGNSDFRKDEEETNE